MAIEIIPAIDIIGGKVVRLRQGDYATKEVYADNPVEQAKAFEQEGYRYLHFVDLDGAKSGQSDNIGLLENVCAQTGLTVDYGGGIRKGEQVKAALDAGAAQVCIGSAAVKQVDDVKAWANAHGASRFIIAADVKDKKIVTEAWSEVSKLGVVHFIRYWMDVGIASFLCTDISKDGELKGPNVELYSYILDFLPQIDLIASGGVSSPEDLEALAKAKVTKAVVGKALYKGLLSLKN